MSFYTRPPFNPWLLTQLCCPSRLCCLQPILPNIRTVLTSTIAKVILMVTSIPTTTATTTNIGGLTFMVFRALLPPTGSRATGSGTKGPHVICSGLLASPLSITSNVSSASPSDTQPLNALNFAAVDNSWLLILLLVTFLLFLGSRTLVQTNMLRLILRL